MRPSQGSLTAKGTAATRAIETRKHADVRICNDPLAGRLADPLFSFFIGLFARYGEWRTHGALTFIACRQRYIDDFLRERLGTGATQVVILGAGLDSRAYREGTAAVRFFEVDHPSTQAGKVEKLKRILGDVPGNVTFVPVDFDAETLDKLSACGFDPTARTVFVWEGVTPYLTLQGVDATLGWISENAAAGSSIVLDYQHDSPARRSVLRSLLSRLSGETRAFEMPEESISQFLADRGFRTLSMLGLRHSKTYTASAPTLDEVFRKSTQSYMLRHGGGRHNKSLQLSA
jgi:methyltransferase (TIGR00027 family)